MMRIAIVFFLSATICFAQELKRPTADVDGFSGLGCIGTPLNSPSMALARDSAGLTTSAFQSTSGSTIVCPQGQRSGCPKGATFEQTRVFSSWQTTGNTYSSLVLNVNSASSGSNGTGQACLKYSINSGASWTTIRCDVSGNGWAQLTDTVTLTPTQSLAALRVSVCTQGNGDTGSGPGSDDTTIWDIWTIGSNSATPPAGNGSSSGNAHRGIVMIRYRKPQLIWKRERAN